MALVFAVMVLLDWRSSQTGVTALSAKDFREIQQLIRRSMWQKAFPDFSVQTILASPGSLYRLAFSHIQQMEVHEDNFVTVPVQTPSGLYLYGMQTRPWEAGPPRWQIAYQARSGPMFANAVDLWGYTVIPVKHGYGLVAGSPRPGYVLPALPRFPFPLSDSPEVAPKPQPVLGQEQFAAGLSNQTRMTLKR